MIYLSDLGYYCSDAVEYEDWHAGFLTKGTTARFLVFLNNSNFLCTNWGDKIALKKEDLETIDRGGKYNIINSRLELVYRRGWKEECEILDSKTIIHPFLGPDRPLKFRKWNGLNASK